MSLLLEASRSQTEVDNANRVAMLGVTTLGLFRAATRPDSRELIGTSLVGANLYAHASSTPSQQRQQIYLAGAEALSCGLRAARLQTMDENESAKLDRALRPVQSLMDDLNWQKAQLRALTLETTEYQAAQAGSCGDKAAPVCRNDIKDVQVRCELARASFNRKCGGRPSSARTLQAPRALVALNQEVARAQSRLSSAAHEAAQLPAGFADAGPRLWRYTEQLQIHVGLELAKVEPDAKSILALAQGMRPVAATLGGAPSLQASSPTGAPTTDTTSAAPATTQAHGSGAGRTEVVRRESSERPLTEDDAALIERVQVVVEMAEQQARDLRLQAAYLNTRLRQSKAELDRCSQGNVAGQLQLVPDADMLSLSAGESQPFQVSGGAGTPQAVLSSGASVGSLSRQLDGSFVFKVSATASQGAVAVLRFSDGAQRLSREVQIKVDGEASAAAAKVPVVSLDVKALGKALGLGEVPNDKALRPALEACLRGPLQQGSPDVTALSPADLAFIMGGGCHG
ncbi:hypothetical protein [Ideonella alba]|uniref:Uncharacterized protein n=1 Tax=Ideonella alba TaxID=2824118 RepID=A0A940YJT4_9BURK|nr:hypothetical protein [Ideonella alba]MBQ0931169.1 hypothetical protein [Ideonella alba]